MRNKGKRKHKNIFRKTASDFLRSAILPALFTIAIIILVVFGLRQAQEASTAEGARILEDSIRRAVMINYAIEGRYPESIEYIEENFGIHIDRERFVVHYRIFATNILPDITVILR